MQAIEAGKDRVKKVGLKMVKKIPAIFSNGFIEPLEKIDIEEGKELIVSVGEIQKEKGVTS